jgi:hemerythrin-like domain-containing protein
MQNRRNFLENGFKAVILTGVGASCLSSGCKDAEHEKNEVSPPEDLMQEHGVLNRILLIYDTARIRLLNNKEPFQGDALLNASNIIRSFIQDYHEKQEENYLFPRFEKAKTLTDLVGVLRQQHEAGRRVIDKIMQLCKTKTLTDTENLELVKLLASFNTMYRPHEAREDTILFPAFRELVSKNEYDSLGEEFEKNEHKLFGKNGFQDIVAKVADIEKTLGIYELSQFTPPANE